MLALALLALQSKTSLPKVVLQIRAAYASCRTYRDTGTHTDVFMPSTGKVERHTITFATAFQRPGRFRFEFTGTFGKRKLTDVLWTTGKQQLWEYRPIDNLDPPAHKVFVWMARTKSSEDPKPNPDEPLADAIAKFTGTSGGTSHTIGKLLFPKEISGFSILDDKNTTYAGVQKLNGHLCDVLELKRDKAKYWFNQKTQLLTQIIEFGDLGDFDNPPRHITTKSTTQYHPQINTTLSRNTLVPTQHSTSN